jgi:hypothetical protein
MDFAARLRAAFLTSIADLFFGASAIVLVVVVLAEPSSENRTVVVPRFVDRQLWCHPAEGSGWLLANEQGTAKWNFKSWLEQETGGQLLIRAGIWTERGEVECYRMFEHAARAHNARLSERGKVTASVTPVLLPDESGKVSPAEAPK